MATLNNSTIHNESEQYISSSDMEAKPLPIITSGQAWPKGN